MNDFELQNEAQSTPGLMTVFAGEDGLPTANLAAELARQSAARGHSVLLMDCATDIPAQTLNITPIITLSDVLADKAPMRDAKYISACGAIAVCAAGNAGLEDLLGAIAALSLSYDCVIVVPPHGCTPAHVRLAGAADSCAMLFHSGGDRFMRAYWMLDAIRARSPRCDPYMVGVGSRSDVSETYDLLSGTIRDFLGGPPPLGGTIDAPDDIAACADYICTAISGTEQNARRA